MKALLFRVWIKKSWSSPLQNWITNKMFYNAYPTDYGVLIKNKFLTKAWANESIVMQYIGRTDCDNKKIYECDIVTAKDSLTNKPIKGVVKFKDSSFCIEDNGITRYRWIDYYDLVVLGNIY